MKKTIFKFSQPTCSPCIAFQPTWEEIKSEFADKAEFVEVDASTPEGGELALEKGARGLPHYVCEEDGQPRLTLSKTTKAEFIEKFLS